MNDLQLLLSGTEQMGVKLKKDNANDLLNYLDLIVNWNKTHNLSAVDSKTDGVKKHLLDSLSILDFIGKKPLLDIGAGAGLPGIVISLMRPDLAVTVIDSVGKKCHFMQLVKTELKLKNLTVVHDRVEQYRPEQCFGQIICRAFASIEKTMQLSHHLLCDNGKYLFMKGRRYNKEIDNIKPVKIHKLEVPFVSDQRFLLEIS